MLDIVVIAHSLCSFQGVVLTKELHTYQVLWWSLREGNTRSHSEHGSQASLR
jgi:hypothetical protein